MKRTHQIGLGIAGLLALLSWGIAIYYWGKLPDVIPTHFAWNGLPDAWNGKSLWYVLLLPIVQILITALMTFLYYKPQYSDMPTTMWLTTLEPSKRDHAFDLIRTMLVGTSLWIGLIMTYLTLTLNLAAFPETLDNAGYITVNPIIILGLVSGMILWLIWWTAKVYRATRDAIKELKE